MQETIKGYIDHVIFRNEDNGYTVMVIKCAGEEEISCVGSFPDVPAGATVKLTGEYVTHTIYGRQFQASAMEEQEPEDAVAMERYLGSGAIKGIGAALAARIVKRFGDETIHVVEEEPERLVEVKGISAKKAREIAAQIREKTEMRRAMIFLQKYGISLNLGVKIYQRYGDSLYNVIRENPYRLAEDIRGVGFRIADEIAGRIGIQRDSDYRIRSGMLYVLSLATGEGHTYLPREELFERSSALLDVDASYMEKYLMDLLVDRKVVVRENNGTTAVYLTPHFNLELDCARRLLMLGEAHVVSEDEDALVRRIQKIEQDTGIRLEERQIEAVRMAASHPLMILTGGPGTGKTTTINAIISYFQSRDEEILLAAPTGRAAKRMTEATGHEAKTIHRLLELSGMPEDDAPMQRAAIYFERNEENPLEGDVIIIDEMSMVDIFLMHALLKAIPRGTRLVLVGDENQLPSVGPGNVLRDIIRCGHFPVVELVKIFRQASESDIIVNAHRIHRGEMVPLDNKSADFFFLKRSDPNQIIRILISLIQEKLPPYVKARPADIQVLTPMRKGVLGVEQLNSVLQRYLNPPSPSKKEKEVGERLFREGDKVMQIRNNYQMEWEIVGKYGIRADEGIGIFNGDTGILKSLNTFTEEARVAFEDGREATYSFKQLEELELAYAITIHKAQGSEYPAVLLPLLSGPRMLLNRNLLYTAVTRAKRCVTVIGSQETFEAMIRNETQQKRYSSLEERINEFFQEKDASPWG